MDEDEPLLVGDPGGPAHDRLWIHQQLGRDEDLRFARPVLDLSPVAWRMWDRRDAYAVVTNQRVFLVAVAGAYSGRRPSGLFAFGSGPPMIIRQSSLGEIGRLLRRTGDRTVWVRVGQDARRLRFQKTADAADFEKALAEVASDEPR